MLESEIRPGLLVDEAARLRVDDVARLLLKSGSFVEVACPACGRHRHDVEFEKDRFLFSRCLHCLTLYVSPRPTSEQLAEYYSTSNSLRHWNENVFPVSESARRKHIFQPRADRVEQLCRRHQPGARTLVDVGAGFGTFCEEVGRLDRFERIVAVEPSSSLAATCRTKNLEVIERPVEQAELSDFDVVTSFELIEHLFEPRGFLRQCHRILSKDGLLILTTPNIMGFDLLVLGSSSDNVGGPSHLNYFHPASLKLLMESCEFEVLEVLTPGELDSEIVRKKAENSEFDLKSRPFLQKILSDDWDSLGEPFQRFLVENNLSSHMWAVARKKGGALTNPKATPAIRR